MAKDRWIAVKIKNQKTGKSITLYHPPANGKEIDQFLRYDILELSKPPDPLITIEALPSGADWITKKIPASDIPSHS